MHSEANELATRWAKQDSIKEGWQKLISFQDNWYLVEKFSDMDNGYQIVEKIRKGEYDRYERIINNTEGADYATVVDESVGFYENGNAEQGVDSNETETGRTDISLRQMAQRGSAGEPSGVETRRNSEQGDRNQQVKYSLKDNIEEDVIKQYGKTYRWSETGYLLKDGSRVDMSGRNDGAPGGYRTIDHRDIFYDISGDYGTDAMIEFMSRGNIRVMPETPGINLQVEPTAEQYRLIQDMVERLGWKQEYFSVDFDNANGDTVDSLTYEGKVSARKVIADIQYYFKEGKIPYQSELSQFRYSLKEDSASAYEYEQTMKFSLVEDKKTLDFLNEQKHIKVYRAMQVIDGELYPPMAAKIKGDDGKTSLVEATQLGKWYQADEHPELVVNGKFTLNKGNGSSITAAYNPYWHTSKSPLNDQFSSAYKRNNLVTVECEVPESELTSGYKAQGAKDSVGEMSWHSGQVSSKLSGEKTRKVILSRWVKVNRIVSDSEVATKIAKLLEGENVSIPDNTITPSLRAELEKLGVEITKSGKVDDIRYSLKEQEYMQAVDKGDLTTAQNLVDETARKEGYTIKAYHGTLAENFTEFKKSFIGSRFSFDDKGFFFIDRKSIAEDYARSEFDSAKKGRVLEAYLKVKKPLIVDSQYALREGLGKIFRDNDVIDVWDNYNSFLLEESETKKSDGIIIDDGATRMIVVFDPNQIKSSEAVTYDDNGKVVPLSERFNSASNDIRFSLKEDSTGKQLSEGQKEFFKDSKVVDEQGRLLVVYHGTKSDFTVFDRTKGGESNSIADVGFWFVADEQGALNWADNSWWGDSEKGKAMPVYLKMDNPKIYESTNNNTDSLIEKARELHRERAKIANKYLYDVDRANGITGVSEWDAFRMLIDNPQSAGYYLDKISEDKRQKVLAASDEYKKIETQEGTIRKQISELHYTSDGYEKFKADLYKIAGQTSEDANIGGVGMALKNAAETKAKFVESLKKQGYDGLNKHYNRYNTY